MSGKVFRPMLSGKVDDFTKLVFPLLASPKLDGIRCLAMSGEPRTRSMKMIPNRFIQEWFCEHAHALEGLDGELIVGEPTGADVLKRATSGLMSESGEPDFRYYAFDRWDQPKAYSVRLESIFRQSDLPGRVVPLRHELVTSLEQLLELERATLDTGYEGLMLRAPLGPYKQGKATFKEGFLMKLKRFDDAEGEIIGFEELLHNGNTAFTNELGRTARPNHQAGMVGLDALGVILMRGITAFEGEEVRVGSGLNDAERKQIWENRPDYLGKIGKFKFQSVGSVDAPRHPIWLGLRDAHDL